MQIWEDRMSVDFCLHAEIQWLNGTVGARLWHALVRANTIIADALNNYSI